MINIKLKHNISGNTITLPLYSNKTVITYYGASGKTFLYSSLITPDATPAVSISCDDREVNLLYTKDSHRDISPGDNCLVVGDEDVLFMKRNVDRELELLKVPLLFICRKTKWLMNADVRGVYCCYYDEQNLFINHLCKVLPSPMPTGIYDSVVTESSLNKSENLLIRTLFGIDAAPCSGKGNLRKTLRKLYSLGQKRVLLLFDTAALGSEIGVINEFSDLMNLTLYDYPSFEGLLYYSKIVQSLPNVPLPNRYRSLTMEREYEDLLLRVTSGTQFKVTHKPSKISGCF